MDFSIALNQVKGGQRLTRTAWRDPGLAVFVSDRGAIVSQKDSEPAVLYLPNGDDLMALDWELVRSS